jgi:hypothetical protein
MIWPGIAVDEVLLRSSVVTIMTTFRDNKKYRQRLTACRLFLLVTDSIWYRMFVDPEPASVEANVEPRLEVQSLQRFRLALNCFLILLLAFECEKNPGKLNSLRIY